MTLAERHSRKDPIACVEEPIWLRTDYCETILRELTCPSSSTEFPHFGCSIASASMRHERMNYGFGDRTHNAVPISRISGASNVHQRIPRAAGDKRLQHEGIMSEARPDAPGRTRQNMDSQRILRHHAM